MSDAINFFVPGKPAPGGSKTAFYNKRLGRAMMVDACKAAPSWKAVVATVAREHYAGPLLTGPLAVTFVFYRGRPLGHYGSGKNAGTIKASAPAYPTTKPDTTKLIRSTEDALTGVIWRDDAQIVEQQALKMYTDGSEGVQINIRRLEA